MLTAAGCVTLYVFGWGIEVPESYIEGTALQSGDTIDHVTYRTLMERAAERRAATDRTSHYP